MSTTSQTEPSNLEPRTSSLEPPVHRIPAHLRYLTLFLLIPLMALATAFFGCISLICGLWDKSGRQQHGVASMPWAQKPCLSLAALPGQKLL